jgi:hypothetical protein
MYAQRRYIGKLNNVKVFGSNKTKGPSSHNRLCLMEENRKILLRSFNTIFESIKMKLDVCCILFHPVWLSCHVTFHSSLTVNSVKYNDHSNDHSDNISWHVLDVVTWRLEGSLLIDRLRKLTMKWLHTEMSLCWCMAREKKNKEDTKKTHILC